MLEHEADHEYGPTYKALFLGACVIIGSTFGWWLTNFISANEINHANYEHRLKELETRADRALWEREALREEVAELKRTRKDTP